MAEPFKLFDDQINCSLGEGARDVFCVVLMDVVHVDVHFDEAFGLIPRILANLCVDLTLSHVSCESRLSCLRLLTRFFAGLCDLRRVNFLPVEQFLLHPHYFAVKQIRVMLSLTKSQQFPRLFQIQLHLLILLITFQTINNLVAVINILHCFRLLRVQVISHLLYQDII